MTQTQIALFDPALWHRAGQGARYVQLSRYLARIIRDGKLSHNEKLPPERILAQVTGLSRVTIRKAVSELVSSGLIENRRGSGSFVIAQAPRTEQSLSSLVSFTENLQQRGKISASEVLDFGIYTPTAEEMMALGLMVDEKVARVERLRSADGVSMALEVSSLSARVLPDPQEVSTSLYAVLRTRGLAPTRAIQRVTAINAPPRAAGLLHLPDDDAILQIDRTGYLANGRPVEFTKGYYRPDIYDFVSQLHSQED